MQDTLVSSFFGPEAPFQLSGEGVVRPGGKVAKNAPFLSREKRAEQEREILHWLMATARGLVRQFNDVTGQEHLYLTECAGLWFLYGRRSEEDVDKPLMYGTTTIEGLSRLVIRLQKGMGV